MSSVLANEIAYRDHLPIAAYFAEKNGVVLLDSAELRLGCGRYSYIAVDPFQVLISKNGMMQLGGKTWHGDPFDCLKEQLARFRMTTIPGLPPFQGGALGYFSYDLGQHLETLPRSADDLNFPDMAVGFYDSVVAFDHEQKRAWIIANGYPETDDILRQQRAKQRIAEWQFRLQSIPSLGSLSNQGLHPAQIKANFTSDTYQTAVNQVIEYILAGDIFEANLSQRFKATLPPSLMPFDLYRRLRHCNPAPFAAYMKFEDTSVASASPERFLQLTQGQVETRPIKGTRRRDHDSVIDEQLATELVQSVKDRAENVMIVDLLRNDLSRVCEPHSVQVPMLCGLESYATVHHLVSVVQGRLKAGVDAVDLLRASFPGGSITGAPKIRAMEIIAELEPTARGLYCGSIGYMGFNGDMDLSIAIRTFAIKNQSVTFQAGGAIVLDSDPLTEYEETLTKAKALIKALTHDFVD